LQLAVFAIGDPATSTTPTNMTAGQAGLQNTNTGYVYYEFLTTDRGTRSTTLGTSRDNIGISILVNDAGAGGSSSVSPSVSPSASVSPSSSASRSASPSASVSPSSSVSASVSPSVSPSVAPPETSVGIYIEAPIGAGSVRVTNCIVYGFRKHIDDTDPSVGILRVGGTGETLAYNNTVYDCDQGITGAGTGDWVARNNAVFGCTTNFVGSFDGASSNNYSDDGTAGSTTVVAANQFTSLVSGSEDFHLRNSADLRDVGADLSGVFTTDVDGQTRSAWDVGADEFSARSRFGYMSTPRFHRMRRVR
jgi:hypothetical protein